MADTISISMLFFGPAGTAVGADQATLHLPLGTTVQQLRKLLAIQYPALAGGLAAMRIAVNEAFADDNRVLHDGDEAALIPPVSGGQDDEAVLVQLTGEPIDVAAVRAFVMGNPSLGAIVTFEGATRGETDPLHGQLTHLAYQAYGEMAVKQMQRLATEAKARWQAGRVAIVHRTGIVPPGEVSVMIAVACGHRAEAFEACRWLIDTLKQDVPIWKQDVFADGHSAWVNPAGTTDSAPPTTK